MDFNVFDFAPTAAQAAALYSPPALPQPSALRVGTPQPSLHYLPSSADAAMVNTGYSAAAPLTLSGAASVSSGVLSLSAATADGACAAVTVPTGWLSLAFWVRPSAVSTSGGSWMNVVALSLGGSCAATFPGVDPFVTASTGYPYLSLQLGSANVAGGASLHLTNPAPGTTVQPSAPFFAAGAWVHVVIVTQTTGTAVYQNGASFAALASASYFAQPGAGALWLGAVSGWTGTASFDAAFADVALFSSALTAAQAAFLADGGSAVAAVRLPAPAYSFRATSPAGGAASAQLINAGAGSLGAVALNLGNAGTPVAVAPLSGITFTATTSACATGIAVGGQITVSMWVRLSSTAGISGTSQAFYFLTDGGTCTASDVDATRLSPWANHGLMIWGDVAGSIWGKGYIPPISDWCVQESAAGAPAQGASRPLRLAAQAAAAASVRRERGTLLQRGD